MARRPSSSFPSRNGERARAPHRRSAPCSRAMHEQDRFVRTWSTGLGESARSALILTDVYLLDTNIVSLLDPRRREHAPALVEWMERNGASLFLSVMTITELDAGVLKLRR